MSLRVFELPIEELNEYVNNSKVHDKDNVEAIKNSIERFGMCDPVGVWKNAAGQYEIVEGHGRKLAMEQLGYETVPCVDLSHLTDEERRVYSHVHNQTTLMTELDLEIAEIDFDGTEFDMTVFGFEETPYIEWDSGVGYLSDDEYQEPAKEMLVCPNCSHKDSKERFKKASE